jgi:hypothetical protein
VILLWLRGIRYSIRQQAAPDKFQADDEARLVSRRTQFLLREMDQGGKLWLFERDFDVIEHKSPFGNKKMAAFCSTQPFCLLEYPLHKYPEYPSLSLLYPFLSRTMH